MVMDMRLYYYFCIIADLKTRETGDVRGPGPRLCPRSRTSRRRTSLFHVHTTEHPTSLRFLSIAGMQ